MNDYLNFKYFNEPSDFAYNHLIVSDAMGYDSTQNFIIDREYFDNNLVMFVLKGNLVVEQNQNKLILTKGQGVLMRLTQKHKYYYPKDVDSNILWFHFNGKACEPLLEILDGFFPLMFESKETETQIYKLFDVTKNHELSNEFTISSTIYEIISSIIKKAISENELKSPTNNSFISKVDSYIIKNISNQIKLEDFAKEFMLSKYHFCRCFREHLHTTPFNYIREKKIDTAKKMLIYTNDSISQISNHLCFCDQAYFTNAFKSVVGLSPNAFRKKTL